MKTNDSPGHEQSLHKNAPEKTTASAQEKNRRSSHKAEKRLMIGGAIVACFVIFVVGATVGYLFPERQPSTAIATSANAESTTWTCSMHPQIKLPKPGKCPICFMDLIPLTDDGSDEGSPRQLKMSPRAMKLAEIQTEPVRQQYATNEVRLVGKVDYDETKVANITAWTPGRLDRLFVDFTGVSVRKGDHLVSMYSPDLIVAQRELILAWNAYHQPGPTNQELTKSLLKSAEEKLRLLGVLPEQIEKIKRRGKPLDRLTIYAPIGGIVIEKLANEGMYVQTGTKIYTIADLSQVWVNLDAYESDVPWLRYGQEVEFTTQSHPGETFKGRIAFIDPMFNEKTRTVRVRVNVPNPDGKLKPGMFVGSLVRSQLAANNKVFDSSLVGKWISPMHPEIVKDGPGKCDICGMDLVPAEQLGYDILQTAPDVPLIIPATAPLITGKRAIVYVQLPDREQPTFEGREVLLGERAGDYFVVRHGLKKGERVVTNGNFKLDSALQIKARPSMMSPDSVTEISKQNLSVPNTFRQKLTPLYEAYLAAVESLAANKMNEAKAALAKIPTTVAKLETVSLDEATKKYWKQIVDRIVFAAYETEDAKRREVSSRHFAKLSNAMIELAMNFGHAMPGPLYRLHCPIATGAKGADWLQTTQQVHNPYYGLAMHDCGDLVATYESQTPLNVPKQFRQQLVNLYDSYFQVQTMLADDKLNEAKSALAKFQAAMKKPEADQLKGRTLAAWTASYAELSEAMQGDWQSEDVKEIRRRFEAISNTMLKVADLFGHVGTKKYYKAFCPMAFNDQGAVWLQADKEIANPYFGHQMLRCGEIQRDFPPVSSSQKEEDHGREHRHEP